MGESSLISDSEISVSFYSYIDQQIYSLSIDWGVATLQDVYIGSDSQAAQIHLPAPSIPSRWLKLHRHSKEGSVDFQVIQGPPLLSPEGQEIAEGAFFMPQTLLFPDLGELRLIKGEKKASSSKSSEKISGLIKDRYRIVRILGEGGFSHVALAFDETSGVQVAIKVIHHKISDNVDLMEKVIDRFFQEMKILMQLNHPHVLKIIDYGFDQITWSPFYVMEYVDGKTLMNFANQFEKEQRWEIADQILEQFLEGLSYLHQQGIVHRDLKPENVIVAGNYPHFQLKILDLGLAKMLKQQSYEYQMTDTKEKETFGTPPYMSPEQSLNSKQVTPASDVYSAGILICMLYSNQYPYEMKDDISYEQVHVQEKLSVKRLSDELPPAILKLITECMEKKPERRPQNASEVLLRWKKNVDYLFFDVLGCQMRVIRRQWGVYFLILVLVMSCGAFLWLFVYRYAQSRGWLP